MREDVATVTIKLSRDGHCSYSLQAVIETVTRQLNAGYTGFDYDVVSATLSDKQQKA